VVWGGPINYLIHEQITQTNSRHLHNESVTNRRADVAAASGYYFTEGEAVPAAAVRSPPCRPAQAAGAPAAAARVVHPAAASSATRA